MAKDVGEGGNTCSPLVFYTHLALCSKKMLPKERIWAAVTSTAAK